MVLCWIYFHFEKGDSWLKENLLKGSFEVLLNSTKNMKIPVLRKFRHQIFLNLCFQKLYEDLSSTISDCSLRRDGLRRFSIPSFKEKSLYQKVYITSLSLIFLFNLKAICFDQTNYHQAKWILLLFSDKFEFLLVWTLQILFFS